jgi:uncharacterized protein YbgA (DUF1722 family)/uncharacterized protein YbbK (DUF523 family)
MKDDRIPIGISACLLGEEVRFDGGHQRDRFVNDVLGDYARWVGVCPEIGAGLGVPRETYRLVRNGNGTRMVGNRSDRDVTDAVSNFARAQVNRLADMRLRGFVLKNNSPTCGMERVRVYDHNGVPARTGTGLFARLLMERLPLLPVEEEGRLNDPRIRENFITRVFTYDRWWRLVESDPKPRDVVAFHTAHKMLILAHSPEHNRALGPLVAKAGILPMDELLRQYEKELMTGLKRIASPGRHFNMLQHLAGFLKNELDTEDKRELHGVFQDYRSGRVPLIAPLLLLYHHLKHLKDEWLDAQVYLQPFPHELGLRSSI